MMRPSLVCSLCVCSHTTTLTDCHGGRKLSDPVCVLLANGSETVQFDNPCYARAAGVNLTAGDRLQRGPCVATCDVECGISERVSSTPHT
jgi:hypothetical protein